MVSCGINTHTSQRSSKIRIGSMHYRHSVHLSLSHLRRGTDPVVMVCGTHLVSS